MPFGLSSDPLYSLGIAILAVVLFVLPGMLLCIVFVPRLRLLDAIIIGFGLTSSLMVAALLGAASLGLPVSQPVIALILLMLILTAVIGAMLRPHHLEQRIAHLVRLLRPLSRAAPRFDLMIAGARILALVFLLCYGAFMIHQAKTEYRFPLHVDEWWAFGASKAIVDQSTIAPVHPFIGQGRLIPNLELGFHVWLASFQGLVSADWFVVFMIFPMVIFAFIQLAAFSFARPHGYGLEAVFFLSLMPTTLRILGPGFLVPVALGMFFVLASLLVASRTEGLLKYILLFLFAGFTFLVHPPSALAIAVAVGWHEALGLTRRKHRTRALLSAAALAAPFVLGLPVILSQVSVDELLEAETPLPTPHLLLLYGVVSVLLYLVGLWLSFVPLKRSVAALALTALSWLLVIVVFDRFHIGQPNVFDRSFLYLSLAAYPVSGYAVHRIWQSFGPLIERIRTRHSDARSPWLFTTAVAVGIALLPAIAAAVEVVPDRVQLPQTGFYHLVSDQNHDDWIWIRDHLGPEYAKATVGPREFNILQGTAFATISGKYVHAINPLFAAPDAPMSIRFAETVNWFANQGNDTRWLDAHGITIIYGTTNIVNPDLEQVPGRPLVWIRK